MSNTQIADSIKKLFTEITHFAFEISSPLELFHSGGLAINPFGVRIARSCTPPLLHQLRGD
jgi:hypothetical protein